MKRIPILLSGFLFFMSQWSAAQTVEKVPVFTHADSLRGSLNAQRDWWDVLRYEIEVKPDFASKSIKGSNAIRFKVIKAGKKMQIDLQEPMQITEIIWNKQKLNFFRDNSAFFVDFPTALTVGKSETVLIKFEGNPVIATRPPWDGGWIFTKDKLDRPWMTVACEGLGASVWMPCKDHLSDEPDNGASLSITVPDTLVAIGNGRLKEKKSNADGTTTYVWNVINPINNYNIIPYIGKYVTWHEDYMGEKGKLDCDYWVIDYNLDKAKSQFKAVDSMLRAFEYWMGPYPFYEDGYKLVEAPHLGMEHQSAIAYGNKYRYGYSGRDLSNTGWGMKWDFIIVHESGHEWFGNNITAKDIADEWIHESFTNYSETLYTDYYFGKEAGNAYNRGIRENVQSKYPIIRYYGVNLEPEGTDEYYKGGNMLHLIRQIINNDSLFRQIWRGLNKTFYHQTVTAKQIENYISKEAHIDFSPIFDQYLRTTKLPTLEYTIQGNQVKYRWTNTVKGYDMPAKVNDHWIRPTEKWQTLTFKAGEEATFNVDPNMFIMVKKS